MKPTTMADLSTLRAGEARAGAQGAELVPALTIVAHPVAERVGDRALLDRLSAGREVEISRMALDFVPPGGALGQPLLDPFVSRRPITLAPAGTQGIRLSVPSGGTRVMAGAPVEGSREFTPAEIEAGVAIELAERVVVLLHLAPHDVGEAADRLGMVGASVGIRRVRREVEQVADLSVPVLIRGETGTGKELVARAVHALGPRAERRFVGVNLAALPRDLAAAELFGAHKGAYTGAVNERAGLFRAADGGSLFLDEIGEASTEVQTLLLRALETGEVLPIGAQAPVALDVRLLAATDANLDAAIEEGRFKAPLLHRLAGYEVWVPPLRERREDIGLLLVRFAREELKAVGASDILNSRDARADPWLPTDLAAALLRYDWPGNVRELRNVIRQLVIRSRGRGRLEPDPRLLARLSEGAGASPEAHAHATPPAARLSDAAGASPEAHVHAPPPAAEAGGTRGRGRRRRPAEVGEDELVDALRANAWDLQAAANALGIPRSSMYDLIDKCPRIRTAGELGPDEIEACYHACGGDLDAMAARLEVSRHALKRRVRELGLGRDRR